MSQADYDIANQLMDAGRTDLNLQLVAGATNNSGATEPATKFAYMWWPDTTTGIMKQRNAANTAWINIFILATGLPITAKINSIINGGLNIWQRGTSFVGITSTTYVADRFVWQVSGAATGVITVTESTDTINGLSESSLKIDVTTVDTSLAAGDFYVLTHKIEGFNTIPYGMGSSDAKQITLSFNVKSGKTGIHCVSFRNKIGDRSYVVEYTVNTIDTWESKTITITGDTTGTWLKDNTIGLHIDFGLAAGSTFTTAADVWTAGNFLVSSNQVNVMDNIANNFFIDQIQLEVGGVATDFERRLHGAELEFCKRYYERLGGIASFQYSVGQCISTIAARYQLNYTEKRAAPTIVVSDAGDFDVLQADGTAQAVTALTGQSINTKNCRMNATVAANLVTGNATRLFDDTLNNSFIEIISEL